MYGSLKTNANVNSNINLNINILESIKNILLSSCTILFTEEFKYFSFAILTILFVYEIIKHIKNATIITVAVAFQLFVYIFIYSISPQRAGIILLITLLFTWIQTEEINDKAIKSKKNILFSTLFVILLTMNVINSFIYIQEEIKYEYSAAKETAQYINGNLNEKNAIFISSHIPIGSAIIPYTKYKFYSPQLDKYFTFTTWDKENENQNNVPIETTIRNVNNRFKDKENIYFIYCYNWNEESLNEFLNNTNAIQIFTSNTDLIRQDEKYIIYKLYNN